MRIFDNEAAPRVRDAVARAVPVARRRADARDRVARRDPRAQRAARRAPRATSRGSADGGIFVGWGSQGYFTQYDGDGDILFDARIARGQDTYRAYRFPWVGTPAARPAIAATSGGRNVYASWNGATEVARWEVLAGDSETTLAPAGSAARSGFETRIRTGGGAFVAVRALDASGAVLGTSRAIETDDYTPYAALAAASSQVCRRACRMTSAGWAPDSP